MTFKPKSLPYRPDTANDPGGPDNIETVALGMLITAGNQPGETARGWSKANLRTEI